jgi:transcriptional regulator with XRE-family HTH domain
MTVIAGTVSIPETFRRRSPLGAIIQRHREARGWSMVRASVEMGLASPSLWSRWETGEREPGISSLNKLMDLFELETPDRAELVHAAGINLQLSPLGLKLMRVAFEHEKGLSE